MQELNENIHRLLSDIDHGMAMKKFKKDTYEDFFYNVYRQRMGDIYAMMKTMYKSENKEAEMHEAGAAFADYAKAEFKKQKFWRRNVFLSDMTFIVALYVFPGILEMQGEDDKRFVDIINEEWKKRFPGSDMQPGDFKKIQSGFRTRILGFDVENWFNKDKD